MSLPQCLEKVSRKSELNICLSLTACKTQIETNRYKKNKMQLNNIHKDREGDVALWENVILH